MSKEELLNEIHRLMDLADAMRRTVGLFSFALLLLFIALAMVSWWFFLVGLLVCNLIQHIHSKYDERLWKEIKRLNELRIKELTDEL